MLKESAADEGEKRDRIEELKAFLSSYTDHLKQLIGEQSKKEEQFISSKLVCKVPADTRLDQLDFSDLLAEERSKYDAEQKKLKQLVHMKMEINML